MMKRYLLRQAQREFETWRKEYEQCKTAQQVAKYQERLLEKFMEAIGGLPERTLLNVGVTKVVRREGYQVKMVVFKSQPKHFVTGALFMPDSEHFQPPYPGVLALVGHSLTAKYRDVYQTVGALLALNGIASLVFDPIDQGERDQFLSEWPTLSGSIGHTMIVVGSCWGEIQRGSKSGMECEPSIIFSHVRRLIHIESAAVALAVEGHRQLISWR
jgi:hypothetical protein